MFAAYVAGARWRPLQRHRGWHSGQAIRAQWNALPTLLGVTFQFEPSRGNTDNLEDTFLLKVKHMGVTVAKKNYPAIGVKTSYGFHQRFPYNAMADDKGNYCATPCQSTMYFLLPHPVQQFELRYSKTAVAQGRIQRRR